MKKTFKKVDALREFLLEGNYITDVEAILLLGVLALHTTLTDIRREGWIIKSQKVPFKKVLRRMNEKIIVSTPSNLPTANIQITEYWLSKWGYDEQH